MEKEKIVVDASVISKWFLIEEYYILQTTNS